MTKNDLQSDLLADLQGAANARPLPVSTPERLPATPALPGPPSG
jgi:tripartite-type tricarboxylate transporter receptor subunit TctC